MTVGDLTPPQLGALLDILIHHETYAEVQSFRDPAAIENYQWPFVNRDKTGGPAEPHGLSSSPLLQLLLTRLVLGAPAVRDLSIEFWPVKFKGIMKQLGEADLSDSYEKGTLGTRKRLATAASVVHEGVTRGLLSGVSYGALPDLNSPYDRDKAEDLTRAWHDSIHHLVYGDLIDEIFNQLTRTEDLEAHSPALKGAVDYAELYLATFLHQVFILSSEGPYLLKLIENVHRLMPYTVIGQTLRLGNAASMINAMSRLFLSKVSMGAISNWIGLTSNAADGMNLSESCLSRLFLLPLRGMKHPASRGAEQSLLTSRLSVQRIVSLVLEWDASDFRKVVEKIKLNQEIISTKHTTAIDKHLAADRKKHESTRKKSIQEQKSIIITIFEAESQQLLESLTDRQHTLCLKYYAAKVAIQDRERITAVFCSSTPDLTTAIVLEGLGALDPMIRVVHKNVDLRKHLGAIEGFVGDLIKTTKPKTQDANSESNLIVVEDFYVSRPQRHMVDLDERVSISESSISLARFRPFAPATAQVQKTMLCIATTNFLIFNSAIKVFQRKPRYNLSETNDGCNGTPQSTDAGDMGPSLQDIFDKIPDTQRGIVLERIEAHSRYLTALGERSQEKMQKVIDGLHGRGHARRGDISGPGIYASRWQALLDETLITPSVLRGPLRFGKDIKGLRAARKHDNNVDSGTPDASEVIAAQHESAIPTSPDVSVVIEALGPQFKKVVAELSRDGLPKVYQK
ncbi:hypothetical protein NUW58_g3243 [Xylaria curta]|uniref:Uncharacterized protein n=1 Tax=Xylaria curta TaxID=42375 RepID=A0ACC1PEK4_9PEZI|nr:hypothetical protein NUW58_g3243 [Xylaria curta]